MPDYSSKISDFLSFLRECEVQNRIADLTVADMDSQTQDILHNIELNENNQYDYICQGFTLRDVRQKRRMAKDTREVTTPICDWIADNPKVIKELERLLGEVRKVEKRSQNRSYINRTEIMKKVK